MQLLRWLKQGYECFAPIAGAVFPWVGAALLLLAAGFGASSWRYAHSGLRTTGTITENVAAFVKGGGMEYYPRVRFRDESGELVQVTSKIGDEDAAFAPGDTVPVMYHAEDPQDAVIVSVWRTYPAAIVLGVVGVALFDLGLILGRLWKQRTA